MENGMGTFDNIEPTGVSPFCILHSAFCIRAAGATQPPRQDWEKERGGRIDPITSPESPLDSDERIDEGIAESFPASDPPSWNGGIEER
jgi:hypothetical protein